MPGFEATSEPPLSTTGPLLEQFLRRPCDQLCALARPAVEKQETLAEDEAVKQEGLGVGFFAGKAGCAIKLADVLQPRRIDAGDRLGCSLVGSRPLPDRQFNRH